MALQFAGKVAFITGAARGQIDALVYLFGESGRYITGVTLPVDAGMVVK